jgi:hypothetical protein
MANRGKKRRRANGELASSRRPAVARSAPLMLDFPETPLDPVAPAQLAQALAISNRQVPIGVDDEEDALADGAFERVLEEIEAVLGDEELAQQIDSRLYLLRQFLRDHGRAYYEVAADGVVTVDAGLLEYAAEGALSGHPDERIQWPVTTGE